MKRLVLLFAALALLLAGCTSGGDGGKSATPSDLQAQNAGPYQGAGLSPPQPRPNFTLTDTAGKQFAFGSQTAGHPTLLFFGFTHCPDICPITMANVGVALKKVSKALAKKTYVVFVTTDVKRDTGPVIKQWLSSLPHSPYATYVGLRGTQAQIDAAQAAAHVTVAEDGGQTHSAELLLYGTDNYARVAFLQSGNQVKQIQHDLPLVAKA